MARFAPRALRLVGLGGLLLALAGCSLTPTSTSSMIVGTPASTTLTVYAAASLQAAFTELGEDFRHARHSIRVVFDFDGSSALVQRLSQGAPADVFASADESNMQKALDGGLVDGTPHPFATNVLEIATPPGNPAGIASFADLAKPGVKVVVCAPEVPCGNATRQVEKLTGVTLKPVSEEQSVAGVLSKVETGEADAGLVYVTDVAAAGSKVTGVPFPQSSQAVNTYPIAVVAGSQEAASAQAFVDFVLGEAGQAVLAKYGFGKP